MKEIDLKEEQIQGVIKATGRVSPHRKRQLEVLRQEASKLRLKYGGEELISSLKDGGKTLECFMPLYDNGITVKEYLEQCWGEMYSALTSCQA